MEKIYIKKIKIDNLWDELNICCELDEKINILIGKNGTGKTTLLKIIHDIITDKLLLNVNYNFENSEIEFSNKAKLSVSMKKLDTSEYQITKHQSGMDFPQVTQINTFDMEIKNKTFLKANIENQLVETELDLILDQLMTKFKGYQLKLKNKIDEESQKIDQKILELTSKQNNDINDLTLLKNIVKDKQLKSKSILEKKNRFIDLLNSLFKDTNKEIHFDENNSLIFKSDNKYLSAFQLSSGEKQILLILLTVLLKENKPFILLMDEPEISLHVEWQNSFIDNLLKLNNNMQVILVTHSPSIVSKGWMDKVIDISKITSQG